ncbi:MAG: hypothetical protein EXS16_11255 [Gemmataceae bacterium]|nr:hypothetical protein [Gemmataceae bacterium]
MRVFPWSAVILAITPTFAWTAPPEIRSTVPAGLQRGVETQLTLYGPGFGPGMELVLPFPAEIKLKSASSEVATFAVKPANDVPVGIFPVRVRTVDGVSNMLMLAVHDLPRVAEVEPNDRLHEAQPIDWPSVITGALGGRGAPHPSKDVDTYKFTVKAGQRLTFVSETRRVGLAPDLAMRLRDSKGRELAFCDDTLGVGVEPRLDYTFKEAGDYTVEVHFSHFNYTGRNHNYQLKIGAFSYARSVFPLGGKRGEKVSVTVTDRDGKPATLQTRVPADADAEEWWLPLVNFPGSLPWRMAIGDLPEVMEAPSGPQVIAWPATVNGRIAKPDEVDRFRLLVKPGQKIRISADAFYHGSALDGVLRVYDPAGKMLAANDNRGARMNPDPLVDFIIPEAVNEVIVALEDGFGRGGAEYPYRMTIELGGPDFELFTGAVRSLTNWPENDALNLAVGQPVKVAVRVVRRGYQGAIQIKAIDTPIGITASPVLISEGKDIGEITLTASSQAPASLFEIGLVGEAKVDRRLISRKVVRHIHIAEPSFTNMRWDWRLTRLIGAKVGGAR